MLKQRLLQHRRGDVLAPKIDAYLRQGTPNFSEQTIAEIARLAIATPRSRARLFSASGLDRCMRQQLLQVLDYPQEEVPNARLANVFFDGNWRHLRWQALFLEMGLVARGKMSTDGFAESEDGEWMLEVGVTLPSHMLRGTVDSILVLDDEPWIVDIKGANPRTFSGVKADQSPYRAYQMQMLAYMKATGVPRALLFYEDKASQEYHEVRITLADAQQQEAQFEGRVAALRHYWEQQMLPDPLPQAPANPDCRSCPFQIDCASATFTTKYIDGGELPL